MAVENITPQECWRKLQEDENSFLVDVRTAAEWTYVGVPNLTPINKELICVEWQQNTPIKPQDPKKTFVNTVDHYVRHYLPITQKEKATESSNLYFICRSGQRSLAAAQEMQAHGWRYCYNVANGFEGPLDENKHRVTAGWKVDNLPWIQG